MIKILKSISSRQSSGLSYVEIIVTVAIIGIVTVVAIANYVGGKQRKQVEYGARQLTQDIRKMQALSLAGKKIDENLATPRPCGYGFFLRRRNLSMGYTGTTYKLFLEPGEGECDNGQGADNQVIEEITLPTGVYIKRVGGTNRAGVVRMSRSQLNIFYKIPFSEVFSRNEDESLDPSKELKIELTNDKLTKTVVIKGSGEVRVE